MRECEYIIGSGWWCGDNSERLRFGDDSIRNSDFHEIWVNSIEKFCNPTKIIMVDSNSPIKPNIRNEKIEFISLKNNLGHSTSLSKGAKFCGWTASALMSMHYALLSDCDYFVYVEQDCLLYGDGIIEMHIEHMKKNGLNFMFGNGDASFQPLQVSFFLVKKDVIPQLLCNYMKIKSSDSELSPEFKLTMCTRPSLSVVPEFILRNKVVNHIISKLTYRNNIEIGYGRERPIDFSDEYFYFQQGNEIEISTYMELVSNYGKKVE